MGPQVPHEIGEAAGPAKPARLLLRQLARIPGRAATATRGIQRTFTSTTTTTTSTTITDACMHSGTGRFGEQVVLLLATTDETGLR